MVSDLPTMAARSENYRSRLIRSVRPPRTPAGGGVADQDVNVLPKAALFNEKSLFQCSGMSKLPCAGLHLSPDYSPIRLPRLLQT